ncbi:MAG: phenylalanine--tRNA ligase subunit beta [Mycoplasmatales bacterium]
MILSYNRLKQLGINLDVETLSQKMFQLGHEVEEVIDKNIENLVIGQVIEIKKHPAADRLNIAQVNIGKEVLQIVCGAPNIAKNQLVIVALVGAKIGDLTISPVKLKGVESNGMICSLAELGYAKDKLIEADYNGIHEIKEQVNIGDNPMEVLGLGDKLLDIFLTANRGDCQSYQGIYNDLAALLNYENFLDNKLEKFNLSTNKVNYQMSITNPYTLQVDEKYTQGFSHYYLKDVQVQNSNWETKLYLLKQGIKAQNSLTDISNQVLIEMGIPSHIYDADKIKGGLNLCLLTKEEIFIGLDEKELTLPKGTLVIKDEEKIVSLAGVMGSNATKITNETKNILLEVAHFNPKQIFNSSKIIGKKTEAAIRYEKDIDNTMLENVANLIINKINKLNPKVQISNEIMQNYQAIENEFINLKYQTVNKILGIEITKQEVINILQVLDFVVKENDDYLQAKAPTYRKDQAIENDLIEEIIRIYNIDNIEIEDYVTSFTPLKPIITNNTNKFLKSVESMLLKQNLNQVITYSLVNEIEQAQFGQELTNSVKLMSALSKEHEYYRKSLIPSLIKIIKENYAYQEKTNNIFEIAQTYELIDNKVNEDTKLAITISGAYQNYHLGAKRIYDFYDLKGILEQLIQQLNLSLELKNLEVNIKELNPYASAQIMVEGEAIGIIGEVVFDYYKKMTNKIYTLEISLTKLQTLVNDLQAKKYQKISLTPKIQRDLTLQVKQEVNYEEILSTIKEIKYLKAIELVDIYQGEQVTKGEKNLTIRINFQDNNNTLQNKVIDEQMQKIIELLKKENYKII